MKTTLSTNQAAHLLLADENADWSYNGAMALCEHLEQLEEYEEEIEFDRVAIRCEFSQYDSAADCAKDYSVVFPDTCPYCGEGIIEEDGNTCPDCEQNVIEAASMDYLQENTTVIEFDGGIIIQQF